MEELSPRLFSFNSPYGACPSCHGLGSLRRFSPEMVVPDLEAPVYTAIALGQIKITLIICLYFTVPVKLLALILTRLGSN